MGRRPSPLPGLPVSPESVGRGGGVRTLRDPTGLESEADTIETFERGPWEPYVRIPCGPYAAPTVALEPRLIAELCRNRPDRYQSLITFMQSNGCDLGFVRRGVAGAGLPQAEQKAVLDRLRQARFRAVASGESLGRFTL